jgi:hypothetical protein
MGERTLGTARESGRAEDERWHLHKTGERFWALGIVTPMYDSNGMLCGYSKIFRDTTDRKRLEEGFHQSTADLSESNKRKDELRYREEEDAVAHVLVQQPMAVYIERVYVEADLNTLDI